MRFFLPLLVGFVGMVVYGFTAAAAFKRRLNRSTRALDGPINEEIWVCGSDLVRGEVHSCAAWLP